MTGAGTGELTTDGTGKGAVRLPGAHSANRRADYWRCRRVSEPTRLLSPVAPVVSQLALAVSSMPRALSPVSRLASQVSRPLSQVSPGLCPVFPAISPPQSETQRTARVAGRSPDHSAPAPRPSICNLQSAI